MSNGLDATLTLLVLAVTAIFCLKGCDVADAYIKKLNAETNAANAKILKP